MRTSSSATVSAPFAKRRSKSGLVLIKRAYISRVEHGHTVPSVATLQKLTRAREVPLYQLFYEGEEPPKLPHLPKRKTAEEIVWGSSGEDARVLNKFFRLFSRMA